MGPQAVKARLPHAGASLDGPQDLFRLAFGFPGTRKWPAAHPGLGVKDGAPRFIFHSSCFPAVPTLFPDNKNKPPSSVYSSLFLCVCGGGEIITEADLLRN